MKSNKKKKFCIDVPVGDSNINFQNGKIAKQADSAVWVTCGESVVLVTVCVNNKSTQNTEYFPLSCEYIEKSYAAGKIPGGFFKREAKPRDSEILIARIIDRSIRPLFPSYFRNEVQIIATVMSYDGEQNTDSMALCGASMALNISNLPFGYKSGPIAGIRIGKIEGILIANPNLTIMQQSNINIFVTVSRNAIIMVEGKANQISEEELIEALFFAHKEGQKIIDACEKAKQIIATPKSSPKIPSPEETNTFKLVKDLVGKSNIMNAITNINKIDRNNEISLVRENILSNIAADELDMAMTCFDIVKADLVRSYILDSGKRIDGRNYGEIRDISIEVGILPRTHGSALFTRGETQAIVTVTLGTEEDEQRLDTLFGDCSRKFMLHYNFPPYSVGETKHLRSISRREIGHGSLAERAFDNLILQNDTFPYTIRIVSEITESNGSSSMASVCGATLALWDAGINLKNPVAGIAMGLIKKDKRMAILSDILGDEDYLGDMDLKVCGTNLGITAIQMDIKIEGLSREILLQALTQAKNGRIYILSKMAKILSGPRRELSIHAPRVVNLVVNPSKIRDIIGSGGKIIKNIIAKTGTKIDISDSGIIRISSTYEKNLTEAKQIIENLSKEPVVGEIYHGVVRKIIEFGAFIEIFPGTEGLCHISELTDQRINHIKDVLQEGDSINVTVLAIEQDGKIRLSKKHVNKKNKTNSIFF